MVLRHEVLHARRQKLHLVDLPEAEMLAHGARQNQTRSENATDYSDRLLATTARLQRSPRGPPAADPRPFYTTGTDSFGRAAGRVADRHQTPARLFCSRPAPMCTNGVF